MPKEKMNNEAYERGKKDFIQDYFENVPFASIGGLEMRTAPQAPSYIKPEVAKEYIRGYEHQAP